MQKEQKHKKRKNVNNKKWEERFLLSLYITKSYHKIKWKGNYSAFFS